LSHPRVTALHFAIVLLGGLIAFFWFIAGALVGVAASFVALPLWRTALTLGRGRMRYGLAGAFVATFAGAAAIIYVAIGSRHSLASRPAATVMVAPAAAPAASASDKSGASAKSMEAEVAALEARLARNGGTADDWTLLAKAYDFMGRPDDARRARSRAANPGAGVVSQMSAGALVAAATATETRPASAEPTRAPAAASVAELEQRVKANPRDVQSWLALADLRRAQHDNPAARDALAKVVALKGMTAQSWADYADVLASLTGGSLTGAAGSAIDSAMVRENVGFLYAHTEAEFRSSDFPIAFIPRLIFGVNKAGVGGGFEGRLRIGDELGMNFEGGVTVLSALGWETFTTLTVHPSPKTKIALAAYLEDLPISTDLGFRSYIDLRYKIAHATWALVRAGVAARSIDTIGPDTGVGLTLGF